MEMIMSREISASTDRPVNSGTIENTRKKPIIM